MRLRESIRPPQRFDNEEFITPGSQQSLRQAGSQGRPPYVDFNPRLPPAAFPSLESPCAGEMELDSKNGQGSVQHAHDTGQSGKSQSQHHSSESENGESDKEMRDSFEDIPMDAIENALVSNGELNPVYVKNMAIMASPVDSPYEDMEDSDLDDAMVRSPPPDVSIALTHVAPEKLTPEKPAPPAYDPQWSDLSPRMQAEILNNLLQSRSFLGVCHVLGLWDEERNDVQKHLHFPNNQIQLEDSELEEMRAKQIRALMRIDNSVLRQNKVPHQLVFRKTSRQCTRKLRDSIGMDYLLCQSGELLAARRFLQKRGIDRSYAGDWRNDMVTLRAPEDDSEPEIFEWKEDLTSKPRSQGENTVTTYSPTPSKKPRLMPVAEQLSRQSFINDSGMALYVNPQDLIVRKGDPFASPRWLKEYQSQLHKERFEQIKQDHARAVASQPSGLVCLQIGSERAAQIQNSERPYIDQEDMFQPSCGTWYRNKQAESKEGRPLEKYAMVNHPIFPNTDAVITGPPGLIRCPPIITTEPVFSYPDEPVQRMIGGAWSYDCVDHNLIPHTSSFTRTRQRLEAVREQQQRRAQRERGPHATPGHMESHVPASGGEPQLPTPPSPEQVPLAMSSGNEREQETAFPTEDAEDTLSACAFEALVNEFLDFGSNSEPEDVVAAPAQDVTLGGMKPEDSPASLPVQEQASGDPKQSLPTPASATHGSGDERAVEDTDDKESE